MNMDQNLNLPTKSKSKTIKKKATFRTLRHKNVKINLFSGLKHFIAFKYEQKAIKGES